MAPDYDRYYTVLISVVAGSVALLVMILVMLPPILINRKKEREERLQKLSHGFEVKLNTGTTPVALKKENDHG